MFYWLIWGVKTRNYKKKNKKIKSLSPFQKVQIENKHLQKASIVLNVKKNCQKQTFESKYVMVNLSLYPSL